MRRSLAVLTLAATAAATSAAAGSPRPTRHYRLKGSATLALVRQTGSPPANGTQLTAGPLALSASGPRSPRLGLGRGAIIAQVSFHAGAFAGSAVLFQPDGAISFHPKGRVSINGQTVSFKGGGPITGGTGRYRDVSGTISFTGGGPAGSSTDDYAINGRIAVPARTQSG